jgi:electron transfer flavoprotein-quinone oxidoreductase
MPDKSVTVDAVIVGAGPAGSAAALELARAGRDVVIVERGPFPGAKNVYGGVVYGRILDEIIPQWWTEVPVQRWVTRRSTMLMTPTQALTVDYRTSAWDRPPYNGMTTYRADFDSWLAGKAVAAGARLVTSTVATGLLRDAHGRIGGVRTDRSDGDIRARIVIACDGVNSFLAKEAGLLPRTSPAHTTLGVKETLALPREVIDERFGLVGDQGLDIEMVGCTSGVPGGGFLYTNLDTVSVGVVVGLAGLAEAKIRPEEIVACVKAHPAIAPYLRGAELKEYSAHLVPEGGYRAMPRLAIDGMLVAGDAASMCLAAGLWLEGVKAAAQRGRYRARRPDAAGLPEAGLRFRGAGVHRRQPASQTRHGQGVLPGGAPEPGPTAASGQGWLAGGPGLPVRSDVDELCRRVLRRADGDCRVPGRGTAPHHRRLRRMPLLHDKGLRACLPGRPVRADHRWRDPVQLRAVLRMRDLLPGVQL